MTLFGTVHQLPVGVKKMMDKSWAPAFRQIFEKINERRYAESRVESRPNFPVNIWVGLEIIKGLMDSSFIRFLHQTNVSAGPAKEISAGYSLLFSDRQSLLAQRRQQLSKEDYRRRCRLRPAIDGTISP